MCVAAVLSALVHLLACAHGPLAGALPKADSVPSVTAHCPPASERHGEAPQQAECQGVDQPVTVHQLDTVLDESIESAPVALLAPVSPAVPTRWHRAHGATDRGGGTARAELGIWRT
ncbi:hypothetical protein ACFU7Y_26885 [Kitasatospora sp. NPDC057542]|uniref:hypothetical protein n=1 Tax=Kitasatospora sp. NPDC057542 TaxID=3346162 RepID=UPI00367D5AC2